MSDYRYFLTGRTGTREVFPAGGRTLEISYDKQDGRSEVVQNMEGSIILIGADFDWIYEIEKLVYRGDYITLNIWRKCGLTWIEDWFEGLISLNSGDWNLDKCTVSLEIKPDDKYTCWDQNADQEINFFSNFSIPKVTVSPLIGIVNSVYINAHWDGGPNPPDLFPPGVPNPASVGFVQKSLIFTPDDFQIGDGGTYDVVWVREEVSGVISPGGNWINIGTNLWGRPPILYNLQTYSDPNRPGYYGFEYAVLAQTISNGLSLRRIFEAFVQRVCSGLSIKSDFFQWNPDNSTQINYATGKASKVLNLIMFQKSDVKRPSDPLRATAFVISPEDLVNDICNIFQLEWEITEDSYFRIEHVSYKNRNPGADTTVGISGQLNNGRRQYTYDNDAIPLREIFRMKEESYGAFKGMPIQYTSSMAGKGDVKDAEFTVDNITTDVLFCIQNSEPNSSLVSDDGFVLIACSENNGILTDSSTLGGNRLNNTLAWENLHKDYWRHNRALKSFIMNGQETLALSVKPIKVQSEVKHLLCCGDTFNPDDLIKTNLGPEGILGSGKFSLYRDLLVMDVLFQADADLQDNDPPVAVPDFASTYMNYPVVIDVLANDYDDDVIIPATLEIVSPPFNGTVAITADYKVRYTPPEDYTGNAFFSYRMRDSFGAYSNNALVTVEVMEGSPSIIIEDDEFSVASNRTHTFPSGTLTANDTGQIPLTVTAEDKDTSEGGHVVILANGGFTYTPPEDFTGDDTFTYTATDSANQTASATVTMTVFDPETIYVSMEVTDFTTSNITETCNGVPTFAGTKDIATFTLRFWEDNAKTTPKDVTGYAIQVNVREFATDLLTNQPLYNSLTPISIDIGSSYIYKQDYIIRFDYFGCNSGGIEQPSQSNYQVDIFIESGTGITIIT